MARLPISPGFTLTLLSRDPAWMTAADVAGVSRIGIDIERLGKLQRQGHVPDARISDHELNDLGLVTTTVRHARPFIRLNPLHQGTRAEIDAAIQLGARSVMLPQFRSAAEARVFIALIDRRAEALLLLETTEALDELDVIVSLPGVAELMVGLNDLSQSLGMAHPMQLAASPVMDDIARRVHAAGVPFGFGGVAVPDTGPPLPVPPDLLLARYAHLRARSAWISRSFIDQVTPATLGGALAVLQERLAHWFSRDQTELHAATEAFRHHIASLFPAAPPTS